MEELAIVHLTGEVAAAFLIFTGAAAKTFKRPIGVVASSAFLLAQIGESSFILPKVGADAGLAPADRGEEGTQVSMAVAVILIAITPSTMWAEPSSDDSSKVNPSTLNR